MRLPLAVLLILASVVRAESPKVDFAHDVLPIIKARCAECHADGKSKGDFSIDTRETILKAKAAVPGKSADSEIVKRITSTDPDYRMPSKGEPLTARQIGIMKAWIDEGMPWQEGFTFKGTTYVAPLKLRRPVVPAARHDLSHPIDRILDAYFAAHHVTPPEIIDDAAFARRVFLDVIGLLPAPEELDAFLKDSAPDKRALLARRLLDDKRAYADYWLTFWNDLLRNDYQGTGYIDGGRKQISAWLYQSLLDNKPYDTFVRELISPTPQSEGFINGIQWRGRVNASQVREIQFSQNVSQVFFGVNMKCASCHDSFIDTWKLADAYGLAAVIADAPLEMNRCDKPTGKVATPRFLWPELGEIDPKLPRARRLEQLANLVAHPDNGRFARTIVNRLWQRLLGRGIVHPVDVMANRPFSDDLLDHLATYLVDHKYDLKKLIEYVVTSRAYQSRPVAVRDEVLPEEYVFRGPEVKRLTAEQFLDAVWQITHTAPGKPVAPVKLPEFDPATPVERRFVRASLVNCDLLMRSLGRPNREQVVTTRGNVLTTLQALDLSNGQLLFDTLARGAANLLAAHPRTSSEQFVEMIYRQALCRPPTAAESASARELVGAAPTAEGLADLLWAVFMLPEFQLVR